MYLDVNRPDEWDIFATEWDAKCPKYPVWDIEASERGSSKVLAASWLTAIKDLERGRMSQFSRKLRHFGTWAMLHGEMLQELLQNVASTGGGATGKMSRKISRLLLREIGTAGYDRRARRLSRLRVDPLRALVTRK